MTAKEKIIRDFLESIEQLGMKIVDVDDNEKVDDDFIVEQYFGTFIH